MKSFPARRSASSLKKLGAEYTLKVFRDFLVPESYIGLVIIHDRTQLSVAAEVRHEGLHALDALGQV